MYVFVHACVCACVCEYLGVCMHPSMVPADGCRCVLGEYKLYVHVIMFTSAEHLVRMGWITFWLI